MKKILLMVPSLGMGGMERMLVNVANALVNKGHEVTVLNLTQDCEGIIAGLNERVRYRKNVVPVKFFLHASLKDFFKGNVRFLPYKYWTKFHSAKYLHKKYIKEKYDTEIAFYTGYCVKIISGCPQDTKKIFWLHGEAWLMDGMIQGFWRQKTAEKVYLGFDQIICVSKRIEGDFYKRFGACNNVTTIRNINDIKHIKESASVKLDVKKQEYTFVAVGRVDNEHKGFDRILLATERLSKENYSFAVWIVGDGKDLPKLERQKIEGALDNVTLWGAQDNPYKFINDADVLICSSNYEGYGLVVSEALILGKPVIATNTTGPAEILGNGQYGMVVDNSTEGIYQGMKAFLDDSALLNEYGQKALLRAEFFDPEKITEEIEKIL